MNAFLAMKGGHGSPPPPPPPFSVAWLDGGLIAGLGDSLTRGVGSTLNANGYLPQLQVQLALLGCTVDIINSGIDSATTGGMNAFAFSTIDPFFDPDRPCVFLYEGGGNDIYFSGDAAVAGTVAGNWTGLDDRVSGWRKILIVSPDRGVPPDPPVSGITPAGQNRTEFRASMTDLRTGLVAGYAPHAEQIVELQDNPLLVCTDLTYYTGDETHLVDLGYGVWGGFAATRGIDVLSVLGTMS